MNGSLLTSVKTKQKHHHRISVLICFQISSHPESASRSSYPDSHPRRLRRPVYLGRGGVEAEGMPWHPAFVRTPFSPPTLLQPFASLRTTNNKKTQKNVVFLRFYVPKVGALLRRSLLSLCFHTRESWGGGMKKRFCPFSFSRSLPLMLLRLSAKPPKSRPSVRGRRRLILLQPVGYFSWTPPPPFLLSLRCLSLS